jgi:prepilin-type N-terminal cleavage/methylation domain-containing protein
MKRGPGAPRHAPRQGFTVIELLIAMAIVVSITGLLAQVVEPGRAAFERVPAELDLQQRGRTAIDVITRAVRSAGADVIATGKLGAFADILPAVSLTGPDQAGQRFTALTVMAPVANGAQGTLETGQADAAASITFATAPCPNVKEVCGFNPGMTAVITDGAGHHDIFIVRSTVAGLRALAADRVFSRVYPPGSAVIEIERHTYALASQADGSLSLLRETAAGAGQPVVDFVAALSFHAAGPSVDVAITVQAATQSLRRVVADRVFKTSIKWRTQYDE